MNLIKTVLKKSKYIIFFRIKKLPNIEVILKIIIQKDFNRFNSHGVTHTVFHDTLMKKKLNLKYDLNKILILQGYRIQILFIDSAILILN